MGKLGTGGVLAIAAGAAAVLYFVMRKPTTPTLPGYLPPPGTTGPTAAQLQAQASTTNTAINDASQTLNNLINSIFS